jgi:hypothetical protein
MEDEEAGWGFASEKGVLRVIAEYTARLKREEHWAVGMRGERAG